MIDSFLNTVYNEGRQIANNHVLVELYRFLKSGTNSNLPHVSAMSYHNLVLLESIKK